MDLYMIIYTAGVIGGVVGPLPYEMDQCVTHRNEARVQQSEGLEAGINIQTGQPMTEEERAGVECEYHDVRPTLGNP